MRERRYLTFDMNNPVIMKRLSVYEQPDKGRSDFVMTVSKSAAGKPVAGLIRQTITEAWRKSRGLGSSDTSSELHANKRNIPIARKHCMLDGTRFKP